MSGALPPERWDVARFQKQLLNWFEQAGRSFPWRETEDPFALLVAEKLLQQTQARDSIIAAYRTLLAAYPSPEALAAANLVDLEAIIRPLGLTYRATELKTMAAELAARHAGVVPDDLASLMTLTGVGAYSARAVLSFAFGQDVAVVDTNVARIYYRVFGILGRVPSNPARTRSLIDLATALLPHGPFAIVQLGAARPRSASLYVQGAGLPELSRQAIL